MFIAYGRNFLSFHVSKKLSLEQIWTVERMLILRCFVVNFHSFLEESKAYKPVHL